MNSQVYAGTAWVDISTQVLECNDMLRAKILGLEYNGKKYALVSVDYICLGGGIGTLGDSVFDKLKSAAESVGVDTFLCGTTHTHTFKNPMIIPEDELVEKVKKGINQAFENMQPVKIGSFSGKNTDFAINRTLKLKDGTYWSIRQAHPCPPDDEIDEIPYFDETVGVIRVDKEDGNPLCVVFTFGCHPLIGFANNLPSSNYPGIAEQLIEAQTGAMAMMFQSCGGDVTEIDYKNYDKPRNCTNVGVTLGITVLEILKNVKTQSCEIKDSIRKTAFPRRTDIPEIIRTLEEERDKLVSELGNCPLNFKAFLPLYMKYLVSPDYPLGYKYEYMQEERLGKSELLTQDAKNKSNIKKYLKNIEIMEKLSKLATTIETMTFHDNYNKSYDYKDVDTEVLGIRLGDAILISAPVEPVSETGRRIRALSPLDNTFIVGYANGYMHYGSPSDLYENGGYETIECMLSKDWYTIYESTVKSIFDDLK